VAASYNLFKLQEIISISLKNAVANLNNKWSTLDLQKKTKRKELAIKKSTFSAIRGSIKSTHIINY